MGYSCTQKNTVERMKRSIRTFMEDVKKKSKMLNNQRTSVAKVDARSQTQGMKDIEQVKVLTVL